MNTIFFCLTLGLKHSLLSTLLELAYSITKRSSASISHELTAFLTSKSGLVLQ